MNISSVEYIQGLFSLIYVAITIAIGLVVISKYIKLKKSTFLYVGLAWMGLALPWIPDTINFILILALDTTLSVQAYLIIGSAFNLVSVMLWLRGLSDLITKIPKVKVMILMAIVNVLYISVFFYLLSIDTDLIGTQLGPFHYEFSLFIEIILIICIIIVLASGIVFARESLQSESPEIVLKGKLILIAFALFLVGAVSDAALELTAGTVIAARILLISASVFFYFGFLLPDRIKRMFLREA